jgi:hypothetical protein
MHLINGNKLNGSHPSKCVSDSLVAPLFCFQKMGSIALIKLVYFTKVKPWVRCIWDLFWIRGKIILNIIFPLRIVVLELGLEVPKGFWLSL